MYFAYGLSQLESGSFFSQRFLMSLLFIVSVFAFQAKNVSADDATSWTLSLDAQHGYITWSLSETTFTSLAETSFQDGTTVTLSAQPRQGYRFSRWTGAVPAGSETSRTLLLTMNSDKSLAAEFVHRQHAGVVAWGNNSFGQCMEPWPNTDYVTVSAGYSHSLAVKSDGSVVAWGSNIEGESTLPEPNTGFVAISAGRSHNVGLKFDGSIVAWGNNAYGQCDVLTTNTDFIEVAAGEEHSLALKSDGSIIAWGSNSSGQCDVPEPNDDFVAVLAGETFSMGLKSNGSVVAWGENQRKQCEIPEPNNNFIAISAAREHGLGLKSDGSVVVWGGDIFYHRMVPKPNAGFVSISAKTKHNLGLKSDGSVVCWGWDSYGECVAPEPNRDFTAISAGDTFSLALKSVGVLEVVIQPREAVGDGALWRVSGTDGPWLESGTTVSLPLGDYTIEFLNMRDWYEPQPKLVTLVGGATVQPEAVYTSGPTYTLSVDAPHGYFVQSPLKMHYPAGSTVTLGVQPRQGFRFRRWVGDVPSGGETNRFPVVLMDSDHSFKTEFAQAETAIVAWGSNYKGRANPPDAVPDFTAISAGRSHSLALRSDGSIMAWGLDVSGRTTVPEPNTDFVSIAVGWDHSLGIKSDGSIIEWGLSHGEYSVPESMDGFVALAGGRKHSLALKPDGSVVAWGNNDLGQCTVPKPNRDFVAITAGEGHSVGLKSDGSIVAWGDSLLYQDLETKADSVFIAISAGSDHTLGLKTDGSIVTWSKNYFGQWSVPEPNAHFASVSTRRDLRLGLKDDGSVVVWGPNSSNSHDVPEPNANFLEVAAGDSFGVGLRETGSLVVVIEPLGAVEAGARWRISGIGDEWRESGTSVSLAVDDYTIEFLPYIPGWRGPDSQRVAVVPENTSRVNATYAIAWTLSAEALDGYVIQSPKETSNDPLVEVNYRDGTTITLNAQSHRGILQPSWTGDVPAGGKTSNSLVVTMDSNKSLVAEFIVVPSEIRSWTAIRQAAGPNYGYIGISKGWDKDAHSALKQDGSIVAWGWDPNGPEPLGDLPTTNTGFVALSAGKEHGLALKPDGSIVTWGNNQYGQCSVPEPNSYFVAISAGTYHSLGLKSDGSIVAWGWGEKEYNLTVVPWPNRDFVAISAAGGYNLALKSDGSIVGWGNWYFQTLTIPKPNTGFVAIAAGLTHSMGLKLDGSVVTWGKMPDLSSSAILEPNLDSGFVAISSGRNFSLALKSDGSIKAWGENRYMQCAVPEPNSGYIAISAGYDAGLALKPAIGMLEVAIVPTEAVEDGARWRLVGLGEVWRETDTSITLPTGKHTIEFLDIQGWYEPFPRTVFVPINNSVVAQALYTPGLTWALSTDGEHGYVSQSYSETNYNPTTRVHYRDGDKVFITAIPDEGYHFKAWDGASTSTLNPLSVRMDSTKTLTANFEINQYKLSVITENGAVLVVPVQRLYEHGTVVGLTPQPDRNYSFFDWSGDIPVGAERRNPLILLMDRDKSVRATYWSAPGWWMIQ